MNPRENPRAKLLKELSQRKRDAFRQKMNEKKEKSRQAETSNSNDKSIENVEK